MKTFNSYLIAVTFTVTQCLVPSAHAQNKASADVLPWYTQAQTAYRQKGPTAFAEALGLNLSDQNSRHTFLKQLQGLPKLPSIRDGENTRSFLIELGPQTVWTLEIIDLNKGIFKLQDKEFVMDQKETFAHNFHVVQALLKTEVTQHTTWLEQLPHSLLNFVVPRAEAFEVSTGLGIAVGIGVLAVVALTYFLAKKKGKEEAQAEEAQIREEKQAERAEARSFFRRRHNSSHSSSVARSYIPDSSDTSDESDDSSNDYSNELSTE